jgi:N-carbamoylputrescine amidase
MKSTRIACLQSHSFPSATESEEHHEQLIRSAAGKGAQIICTQELFRTEYFCQTQTPEKFDLAEAVPGPVTERFSALAAELNVVLILSLFEKRTAGRYHNTAVVLDADGSLCGTYRKTHIPQDPGFEEKYYFTPGDTGFQAFDTAFGRIGVVICWDQWFPEAARLTAMDGAEMIFCPTAIGWLPEEKAALGETQLRMWKTVQQGHAIANGCHWAAVNRTGTEGSIEFWGNSFVADYTGTLIASASADQEEILLADLDLLAQEEHRRIWPFFRDRRPEMYCSSTSLPRIAKRSGVPVVKQNHP